mmetsp:Transcript_27604/g.78094  ORF Transcript_27604/g.78094 Transcript_27604/m.78094 type:complete len:392 (-) Transcript_27604:130-1305(-)
MGIDFRGKGYVRRVRIGKRTVKEGEAVAKWDSRGKHNQVAGPSRLRLWWSTIRFLDRHVAEAGQYLRIQHADGTIEHMPGPIAMFENPVYHLGMTVEDMIKLADDSQQLMVRRHAAAPGSKGEGTSSGAGVIPATETTVVTGPTVYFPQATDAVRVFTWSDRGAGALLVEGKVLSTRATVVREPQCELRGADGHIVTATVSLHVRVVGIQEALVVADPISECDAVVRAAAVKATENIRFGDQSVPLPSAVRSATTTAAFTDQLTTALRERAGCEFVALEVTSVTPSPELAKLQHREDELAAAKLTEQLADAALTAAAARQEREQALEEKRQAHALRLETERENAARQRNELESKKTISFLKQLRGMNVNMTEFLCRNEPQNDDAKIVGSKK